MNIPDYRMENIDALWLLWLLPLAIVVYGWRFYRTGMTIRKFAESGLDLLINKQVSFGRQIFKACLLLLVLAAMVVGLTQPGWNPHPQQVVQKGRDIVILVDVSRSMLAEDLYPSRLERAKIAIHDLLETLKGDRVGLIAFAGTTSIKCPLTRDYAFVSMAVDELNPDQIGQGGTLIGDAVRKASEHVFSDSDDKFRDIILITDGEDQDSFPKEAAQAAGEKDIRVFVIGIGDRNQGARIPIEDEAGNRTYLKHDGVEKWTRLEDDSLKEIALATPGGAYWAFTPGTTLELDRIYNKIISGADQRELETRDAVRYDEKFQIFFALALGLLMAEMLISEKLKTKK